MAANKSNVSVERIQNLIYLIRGEKVMLDTDLAALYGVETRVLNQAVKRNLDRFPADFLFQLSEEENDVIIQSQTVPLNSSQIVMSSVPGSPAMSSQIVMTSPQRRGLAYRRYAFTEQGVAMLSSVLRSPRAVQVNIAIMRAFVQLRSLLSSSADLARKLEALEKKYDAQFRSVFDAIRALMSEDEPPVLKPKREIGFHAISQRAQSRKK